MSRLSNGIYSLGKLLQSQVGALWSAQEGQDVAEYAVMMAVILVIVLSTMQLIASNAGTVFSSVGSKIQ
jgi:Flp pilus assembly pilin Flp